MSVTLDPSGDTKDNHNGFDIIPKSTYPLQGPRYVILSFYFDPISWLIFEKK